MINGTREENNLIIGTWNGISAKLEQKRFDKWNACENHFDNWNILQSIVQNKFDNWNMERHFYNTEQKTP